MNSKDQSDLADAAREALRFAYYASQKLGIHSFHQLQLASLGSVFDSVKTETQQSTLQK